MKWLLVFLRMLIHAPEVPRYNVGVATTFSAADDPQNPVAYAACLHRDMDDKKDMIIAHRDLPCRAKVIICLPRTNRCVIARVGDRGPYGKKKNGDYRAAMDLSPAVRKALRHNGYETVWWRADM